MIAFAKSDKEFKCLKILRICTSKIKNSAAFIVHTQRDERQLKIMNLNNVNFCAYLRYKDRYIPDKQDQTRDIIRAHVEEQLGPEIFYAEQLKKERMAMVTHTSHLPNTYKPTKSKRRVDAAIINSAGIYAFSERRKNELYSGAELSQQPEKLKILKKAGIQSIVSLLPYEDYRQNANGAGLRYTNISELGNSNLNVFDIENDLIDQLIRHPEQYASKEKDGKIAGLKEFVKILNGESDDFPLPIYFGCQLGTDRTFLWYQLYLILKNENQNKPLSEETVQKLVKYSQEVKDSFRW